MNNVFLIKEKWTGIIWDGIMAVGGRMVRQTALKCKVNCWSDRIFEIKKIRYEIPVGFSFSSTERTLIALYSWQQTHEM